MSGLFSKFVGKSKKKKVKKTDTEQINDAIQTIRAQIRVLSLKKERTQKEVNKDKMDALKYKKQKKVNMALNKLKLAKKKEARINNFDNQIWNLETQIMTLDETLSNKNYIKAMQESRNAMVNTMGNPDKMMEDADDLMDDLNEIKQYNDDIANILGTNIGNDLFDDDELLQEFEEMELSENENNINLYQNKKKQKQNKKNINKNIKKNNTNMDDIKEDINIDDDEFNELSDDEQLKVLEMELNQSGVKYGYKDKTIVYDNVVQSGIIQCF